MFEDLKLKNGDLIFDNLGKLDFVSDTDSISQSVNNRLNTVKGDLFYNLDYGISGEFKTTKKVESNKAQLEAIIKNALYGDSRILNVELIDLNLTNGAIVSLKLTLINAVTLDLNYQF